MFAFGGYSDYKIEKCPSNHDETISLIIIVMSTVYPLAIDASYLYWHLFGHAV